MKRLLITILVMTASASAALAQVARPMEDVGVVDNTPDSINKAMMARPVPGSSRKGNNPVLFLIGNSTMRNGTAGNGYNGQLGWDILSINTLMTAR